MEFLLVLSALMSALTGAFTGPREGETRLGQAEAQLVAVAQAAAPAQAAAIRPRQSLPTIAERAGYAPQAALTFAPAPLAPLAFIRLIE